jgi:hypothetical protein
MRGQGMNYGVTMDVKPLTDIMPMVMAGFYLNF